MAFVQELRKRKVVRVAIAYLVVAWIGVQVASIALPAFDAPAWVLRVLILVLALGFPLALVLAWAVDLTPAGPRWEPGGTGWKRLLAFSAAMGVLAVGWYAFGQPAYRGQKDAAPTSAVARERPFTAAASNPAPATDRSIAVLPFVNMSGDKANDYFSDGLAETTLDMLAQVHDLRVIARTSSFAFKGKSEDVRVIGRALDAAHLLEGSVQQAGDTVRITAQLVRTRDGAHLWSHKYDRRLTDVFKIQDEIAGEVVKALQLALPAEQRKRLTLHGTGNLAAYQEFLRGTPLLPERNVAKMRQALAHFEKAVAIDPGYAAAHAQAAIALGLIANYSGDLSPAEKARQAAHIAAALRLDPGLGEAYAARAMHYDLLKDVANAGENYRHAVDLSPNYASGLQWYGEYLMFTVGDSARALPMFARATAADPLSPQVRSEYIFSLAASGREDEALAMNAALLAAHPQFAAGYGSRATILEARGDLVGALAADREMMRRDPDAANRRTQVCFTLLRFSALREARACAAQLRSPPVARNKLEPLRASILQLDGKTAQALALVEPVEGIEPWDVVDFLIADRQYARALAKLQVLEPEMFIQPEPRITSSYPADGYAGGVALLGTGAVAQGRDLLQRTLRMNASRPVKRLLFGKRWLDAMAWAALGDTPKSCAALRASVAAGFFLDLATLDRSPEMAKVRADACYAQALAPARAAAAAQVAAAHAAGLL